VLALAREEVTSAVAVAKEEVNSAAAVGPDDLFSYFFPHVLYARKCRKRPACSQKTAKFSRKRPKSRENA